MTKVLLVDDDVGLTQMLSQYLAREGYEVRALHDGEAGAAAALSGDVGMVVMDVTMPRVTGIEALRRIRSTSDVPVLMLSARGDNIDRIVGLDMGADDYMPKPCSPGELVARIRAIIRRTHARSGVRQGANGGPSDSTPYRLTGTLHAGDLTLYPGSRCAWWRGSKLELTGSEFSLLEVLARHAGQLISKQDISVQAFGRPLARFDRRIDVHISSIRQKLGRREDGMSWIHSVRGLGYQLLKD